MSGDAKRVTSRDHVALQLFWQGYDAYAQCARKESAVPCLYNSQSGGEETDDEFVHIAPVDEVRERLILDDMRVQLVSVRTGKYLRGTHVSKFLKWSRQRDEQTVFRIQIQDGSPLTTASKFTLRSCFWPDQAVGFTQTFPLGGSRALSKAVGFLTIEKRKHQTPLLFPIRFRAILRSERSHRGRGLHASRFDHPTPFVTSADLLFIEEDNAEIVSGIPLARLASPVDRSSEVTSLRGSSTTLSTGSNEPEEEIWENCTYCGTLFHMRAELMAHIRDNHGDILHRVPVPGTFCVHCGSRRVGGVCARCG
jgi:hypothetical protein